MAFRPDDIAVKEFLVRARGYDREEVAAFLRAVAADYRQALAALEAARAPEPAGEDPATEPESSPSERWAAVLTERRAADLLEAASRRLEEVATRERRVAEVEQRVALQLRAVREALRDAQLHVRHAAPEAGAHPIPA
jgi:DivIVA domain-containing protein